MKRNVCQAKKNFKTTSVFFFASFFGKENLKTHKTVMFTMATFTAVKPLGKLILFFWADQWKSRAVTQLRLLGPTTVIYLQDLYSSRSICSRFDSPVIDLTVIAAPNVTRYVPSRLLGLRPTSCFFFFFSPCLQSPPPSEETCLVC